MAGLQLLKREDYYLDNILWILRVLEEHGAKDNIHLSPDGVIVCADSAVRIIKSLENERRK
jgi:hypothetical protein